MSNSRAPRAAETCHFVFSLASCTRGVGRGQGRGLGRAGVAGSELATPGKAVAPSSAGSDGSTCPSLSQARGANPGAKDENKEINNRLWRDLNRPAWGWRNEANQSEGVRAWGLRKAWRRRVGSVWEERNLGERNPQARCMTGRKMIFADKPFCLLQDIF